MTGRKQFDPSAALDRATREFWTRGYHGTSLRDLVAAMSISRASLYSTYGDKEDLFLRCLHHYTELYGPPVYRAFSDNPDDARAALRAMFDASLTRYARTDLPAGCLIARTAADLGSLEPAIANLITGQLAQGLDLIREVLDADVARGKLPMSLDTEALAVQLTATSHGLSVLHASGVPVEALSRAADQALAALLAGEQGCV